MALRSADLLKCFCGRRYTHSIDLEEHRRARGHFPSHICRDDCKHPPAVPHDGTIRKCDYCGKICERLDILQDHCVATGHLPCSEFKHPFQSQSAHRKPLQQKSPGSAREARNATAASAEDQACTRCWRTFPSSQSLQQHRASIKHKLLSALGCPVGDGCTAKFSAPSALLHYLESGSCSLAMDRDDILDIVQLYDKDCTIYSPPTVRPSNSTYLSLYRLSLDPESPLASLDSPDGWSLITPTRS